MAFVVLTDEELATLKTLLAKPVAAAGFASRGEIEESIIVGVDLSGLGAAFVGSMDSKGLPRTARLEAQTSLPGL